MSTLKITVGDREHLDERTRDRIEAAREGAELEDDQPVLNLGSSAELHRLFSPTNLELLATISEHSPGSIRETAQLVGRDYRQVHENLGELEDVGVLEFEGGGPGRPKRPTLPYDGLAVDLPFSALAAGDTGVDGADAD